MPKTIKRKKKTVAKIVPSTILKLFDIPLELLEGDDMNPNEMSPAKFDELVESIRNDGFDEPIQVIPHPREKGKYLIAGGHHRVKAARKAGMKAVPAAIKEGWTEDQQKIALVKRNILHGRMNSGAFTRLYNDLARKYDPVLLKQMMAFTEKKEFESVYDGVAASLPQKQRKALAKAKERIKSVDDLSSVLNTIFKEAGSEIQQGYAVFSFGGKEHHYIQIDAATNKRLKEIRASVDDVAATLKSIIMDADIAIAPKKRKRKVKK